MAIISYDYGHGVGQDRGAEGIVNEEVEIRRYAPVCISELEKAGHTCVNCTPTDMGMTLQQSLSYRTDKANSSGSVLHICFHVDAFQHTANPMGAEIEVASDNGATYGQAILTEICKLGFINRGIKYPNLWVTKNTNMTACLIEPFFVDSEADVALYNPQTLGEAIANGVISILGKGDIKPSQPIVTPVVNVVPQPVPVQPQSVDKIAEAKKFIGNRAMELQQKLNRIIKAGLLDMPLLVEDSDFGLNTYNKVILFQGKNSLVQDGMAGNMTFSKLDAIITSLNIAPTPQPTPVVHVVPQPVQDIRVQQFQHNLNRLFNSGLVEDNIAGGQTNKAMAFATSIFGVSGLDNLLTATNQVLSFPLLQVGSQGYAVRFLQYILHIGIDGDFGNVSKAAVVNYQVSKRLSADGEVGQQTWSEIMK